MTQKVIIVLGVPSDRDGNPTKAMRRRTLAACRLWHEQDQEGVLLLSGGQTSPHHRKREAEVMARLAMTEGKVPSTALFQEGQSRNTLENAIFARRMIERHGWQDVHVVTDQPHRRRARFVFKAVGINARFHAPEDALSQAQRVKSHLYEIPALIWYGVRLLCGHHNQYKNM